MGVLGQVGQIQGLVRQYLTTAAKRAKSEEGLVAARNTLEHNRSLNANAETLEEKFQRQQEDYDAISQAVDSGRFAIEQVLRPVPVLARDVVHGVLQPAVGDSTRPLTRNLLVTSGAVLFALASSGVLPRSLSVLGAKLPVSPFGLVMSIGAIIVYQVAHVAYYVAGDRARFADARTRLADALADAEGSLAELDQSAAQLPGPLVKQIRAWTDEVRGRLARDRSALQVGRFRNFIDFYVPFLVAVGAIGGLGWMYAHHDAATQGPDSVKRQGTVAPTDRSHRRKRLVVKEVPDTAKQSGPSPNDQRSIVTNPNSPAPAADRANPIGQDHPDPPTTPSPSPQRPPATMPRK